MNTFFSYLVELFFYSNNISADLHSANVYAFSCVGTIAVSFGIGFLYYFFFDTARYSGFKTWFLTAMLVCVSAFCLNFTIVSTAFADWEESYLQEYILYALVCAMYSFLSYFMASIFFKRFAKSLSRTPL